MIFWQKVSKPTKTNKKDYSFHNTVLLKKPHSFKNFNFTQLYKKYTAVTQPKTCFWSVLEKKSLFEIFCFRDGGSFLSGGGKDEGVGEWGRGVGAK